MSFYPDRLHRLQAAIAGKAGDDARAVAMYVRDTANIEWLTGFENVFDEERAHALWVLAKAEEMALHTDSRYSFACMQAAQNTPIVVDEESIAMAKWAHGKWDETCKRISADAGIDADAQGASKFAIESSMSLLEYRALEKELEGSRCIEETDGLIIGLRGVKDADEIEKLKAAQAVTDAGFNHICKFIRCGMTEREVQLELDSFMLKSGAQSLAFPTIVACGENAASPHAIVSDKRLEAGQCMVMDFGAKRYGYCSDMTRTVFLGKPDSKMESAWEAIRNANEKVEASLCVGMTGKEAHDMAIAVIDEAGFAGMMGHGLGHGVGLEIHEEPSLSPRNPKPLSCGNVVTVEPGIYIPHEFGMRLEDFGVITEDGFEVFTQSTHDTIVL